jgi:glutamine amidotransferase
MIVIVDYGMGNLNSVKRRLDSLAQDVVISNDSRVIAQAERLILPGVGHFGQAMDNLKKLGLIAILNDLVIESKIPVLGICLGMQLMTKSSEEGDVEGLGWFDCNTEKMKVGNNSIYKLPHIGWNTITFEKSNQLMEGIELNSEVYFVHNYGVYNAPQNQILNHTDYGSSFVSALQKDNIIGMQYHPEKSHDVGLQILRNFLKFN